LVKGLNVRAQRFRGLELRKILVYFIIFFNKFAKKYDNL
jgi:hypothetical protein